MIRRTITITITILAALTGCASTVPSQHGPATEAALAMAVPIHSITPRLP